MYKIKVDVPAELPQVIENVISVIMPSLTKAVELTAVEGQTAWQSGIWKTSGVWLEHKQRAISSIQFQMTSPLSAEIWSEDPVTKMIEEGYPMRDLKAMLDTSDKIRQSKGGKKYLYIPFRHNITGASNGMPAHVYDAAKMLAPSSITGRGKRLSAAGKMVSQAQYKWGHYLEEGLVPKKKPYHTTDIYAGMVKMKTSQKLSGGSHAYMTFRTMVEGSSKWLVPARPGHYVLQTLSNFLGKRLEKNLKDAITQALS